MNGVVPIDRARGGGGRPNGPPPLRCIDPVRWQGQPLPVRRWIVEGFIPMRSVTMISGDGGLGKSLLAMQLSTACATGKQWLGLETTPCKTLAIHCEDTDEELQIRQHQVNKHYDVDFGDLENLSIASRVGDDNVLLETDKFGRSTGKPTLLFNQILSRAHEFGAQLVILDSLHDLFSGNENVRSEARAFIGQLRRIALEIDGAVVLLSHPSAAGLSSGNGTSGSTAWNAAVRSRLYLTRGDPEDRDARVLRGMKSNYANIPDEIPLRWDEGVFIRTDRRRGDFVDAIERDVSEAAFLVALDAINAQLRPVSESPRAANYAPKLLSAMPQAAGHTLKQLEKSMMKLLSLGVVERGVIGKGPDRHDLIGLRRRPS